MSDTELINAQMSADAGWQRSQDLEEANQRLRDEVATYRKQSMRQYYAAQGFMAVKAMLDRYRANIACNSNPDVVISQLQEIVREHKTNMERVDARADKGG